MKKAKTILSSLCLTIASGLFCMVWAVPPKEGTEAYKYNQWIDTFPPIYITEGSEKLLESKNAKVGLRGYYKMPYETNPTYKQVFIEDRWTVEKYKYLGSTEDIDLILIVKGERLGAQPGYYTEGEKVYYIWHSNYKKADVYTLKYSLITGHVPIKVIDVDAANKLTFGPGDIQIIRVDDLTVKKDVPEHDL